MLLFMHDYGMVDFMPYMIEWLQRKAKSSKLYYCFNNVDSCIP